MSELATGGPPAPLSTAEALEVAIGGYRVTGDAAALQEAARAHLDAARAAGRPPETAEGEYTAVQEAVAGGQAGLAGELAALSTEVTFLRLATAYDEGSLPGTGHSASVGIGG